MFDFEILPELEGQNIVLKLPRPTKKLAQQIFETISVSRENFEKWMPWTRKIQTFDDCLRFLKYLDQEVKQQDKLQYLIFDKKIDRFYGLVCCYNYVPLHKRGELGVWLDLRYRGRHLAFDAVATLEKYLFASGVHRLEIHCEPDNKSSYGLAKKLGYKKIARLKDYRYSTYQKKFCDSLYLCKINPRKFLTIEK